MSEEIETKLKRQYEDLLGRVVSALADRSYSRVSRQVSLHENTIRAIAQGKNKKPSIDTLEILADYLFGSVK